MQNLERKFIQKLQKYMTCTSHGKQKYLIFLFPNVLKEILLSQNKNHKTPFREFSYAVWFWIKGQIIKKNEQQTN